ncbi:MAG: efflux RND transporter periplasmic adaptor subunit [Burkholderiaceae bacterium]|nr:efflux RND transporter periplasmic adaptor subunit [Burkholderiaceae bacterium]MDH3461305.1 efflux RND transporter periplasmic adaptor subunit [Burkholderiaceae bacterium]
MNALQSSRRSRWMFGAIIVAVLLVAVLISRLLIATAPRAERRAPERQARLVETATLQPSTERVWVSAHGQVEAAQRINLSAQVTGRVTMLSKHFVPGQRVPAGELLLQIDPSDYQIALNSAQAGLASAEAALAQERGSQSVARGDFAVLDLKVDDAERALMLREPQLRAAEAAVQAAQATVAQARLNLERTAVRAPFDALILSRSIGVGAQISGTATVLGELAAAHPLWVTLLVPVDSLRWIALPGTRGRGGSAVQLRDVSQPQAPPWSGRVIQALDAVETQGRRARILVEVGAPAADRREPLLLGAFVDARIAGRELEQVFRLDPAWLDGSRAWAVRDDRLRAVDVQVLHRGDSAVLVRGSLRPGERIVSSLLPSAVEGMRVRAVSKSTPPGAQNSDNAQTIAPVGGH